MLSTLQIEENATDKIIIIIIIAKVCKCGTSCGHPRVLSGQKHSKAQAQPPLWVKPECRREARQSSRSAAQPVRQTQPTEDRASLALPG